MSKEMTAVGSADPPLKKKDDLADDSIPFLYHAAAVGLDLIRNYSKDPRLLGALTRALL